MIGWIVVGFLIVHLNKDLPDANGIRNIELKVPLRVYSADNLLISEFGNERRKPLTIDEFPQTLIDAVLASEDDNFYNHTGIDLFGLVRATLANLEAGGTSQGASTITMQVARNFYLSPEKTYTRKIREILLALKLEQILSKDEILSLYLNKIFLGHRSYGFGAAAQVYYNKELSELSVAEQAMLAGLPKAPSSFNPLRNPVRAVQRRNYVLGRMHDIDKLNEADYNAALAAPVTARRHSRQSEVAAPHIAEMVRAQLIEEYGEDAYWSGLSVYTTVQSSLQAQAQESLRKGLEGYDRRHGFRGAVAKVALEQLQVDLSTPSDAYELALEEMPRSGEQRPALVLSVDKLTAQVYVKGVGLKGLSLEDMRWARRYKTADLLGDWVSDVRTVLSAGDVVYVMPRALTETEQQNFEAQRESILNGLINTANEEGTLEAREIALENLAIETEQYRLSQLPDVSGAVISINPNTGQILSLAGGYDFFLNKYNRAVQSIRQPGSNIKPFIYSASLDKGFTPASLISGAPIVMTDPAHGTVWRPENYSGKFFGPTRMRDALSQSMNLVSIRLLRSIGIPYTREYLERFGLDMNRFSASLTMALGSGGITPLELLAGYGVLANGGYRVEPYFIERIEDRDGNIIFSAPQPEFCDACYEQFLPFPELEIETPIAQIDEVDQSEQDGSEMAVELDEAVIDEANEVLPSVYDAPRVMNRVNNFLTVSMLKDVIRRGTARKALSLNRNDLAGKTGTTNDYIDAWFTGFNSQVATTVWVGFDEPSSMGRGEAGSRSALPIWIDYMEQALADVPQDASDVPEYIEAGFVNRDTGVRTSEDDPEATREYFALEPTQPELIVEKILRSKALEGDELSIELLKSLYPSKYAGEGVIYDEATLTPNLSTGFESYDANPEGLESLESSENPIDAFEPNSSNEKIIETDESTEGLF